MNVAKAVPAGTPIVGDNAEIDWSRIDTGLQYEGKAIKLPGEPGEMPIPAAIQVLERIAEAEAQIYAAHEVVHGIPWDALVAVYRALESIYGVILPQSAMSFFGPKPPSFLTIKTGPHDADCVQVPVGKMLLPGMKTPVHVGIARDGCHISGEVNKKDQARLLEVAIKARGLLKTQSICRGKALIIPVDDDGDLSMNEQPEFMDLASVTEESLIHNELTRRIIETSIFCPIRHAAACRKHGIPLKRGILLEGRYGCGKSLTARVTAKICEESGWTFILISRAQGLKAALDMAKLYEPCVVFAEDLDRFGDRSSEEVNDLINLLDGAVPAKAAIMTILTTNHIELIDKALLRPGRLDAVISIDAPDAPTVEKLVRYYAGPLLPGTEDVGPVGERMAGQIPASIAEIVKRSKLAMIYDGRERLLGDDLVTAAETAMRHLALLEDKRPEPSTGEKLAESLIHLVADGVARHGQVGELVDEMAQHRVATE